jgi:hypothetical protein
MASISEKWHEFVGRIGIEFLIVVLGVTVALRADSWVAERAERNKETARLHGLLDNVFSTLIDLRAERENASGAADALKRLALYTEKPVPENELGGLLQYAFLYGSTFSAELNVYEDLKSSGELALLSSTDLRQALAKMDSRLVQVTLAQFDLTAVMHRNFDSYWAQHTDMRLVYDGVLGFEGFAQDGEADYGFMLDPEFRNRMMLKLDLVLWVDQSLKEAEDALVNVENAISDQLGVQNDH